MSIEKGRILKMSKVLNTLLIIGGIVLILVMVSLMVLAITVPSVDQSEGVVISVWGTSITLDGSVGTFRASMIITMLSIGVMAAILLVASLIFKDMSREGMPFTEKNSNRIRVISLLLIAQGLVVPPLQLLIAMVFSAADASDYIGLDLSLIVIAIIFFCLALIFEYGAELQRQSDETL